MGESQEVGGSGKNQARMEVSHTGQSNCPEETFWGQMIMNLPAWLPLPSLHEFHHCCLLHTQKHTLLGLVISTGAGPSWVTLGDLTPALTPASATPMGSQPNLPLSSTSSAFCVRQKLFLSLFGCGWKSSLLFCVRKVSRKAKAQNPDNTACNCLQLLALNAWRSLGTKRLPSRKDESFDVAAAHFVVTKPNSSHLRA